MSISFSFDTELPARARCTIRNHSTFPLIYYRARQQPAFTNVRHFALPLKSKETIEATTLSSRTTHHALFYGRWVFPNDLGGLECRTTEPAQAALPAAHCVNALFAYVLLMLASSCRSDGRSLFSCFGKYIVLFLARARCIIHIRSISLLPCSCAHRGKHGLHGSRPAKQMSSVDYFALLDLFFPSLSLAI